VRRLVARGIKTQVIFSILKENQAQVDAIVRLAEDLGAQSVKFNLIQPMSRGQDLQAAGQTPGVMELLTIGRHVEHDLAPAAKLELLFDYPMAFRPLSRIASGDADGTCGILNILGVVAQGFYALCGVGELSSGLVFGKVGADDLKSIWYGNSLLLELRSGLPARLEGTCRNCLMKWRCLGSCIAQTYFRTGRLWSGYWFCESAKELNVFPGSRSQE
jgi:SynChlorMet cassette radical SAM/SPASM protein ScmF